MFSRFFDSQNPFFLLKIPPQGKVLFAMTVLLMYIFMEHNRTITTCFRVIPPRIPCSCELITVFTCCISNSHSVTVLPTFLALVNKYFTYVSPISFTFLATLGTKISLYMLLALQMFLYVLFLSSFLSSFLFIHAVLLHCCFSFICNFLVLIPVLKIMQRLPAFFSLSIEQTLSSIVFIFWCILPLSMKAFNH